MLYPKYMQIIKLFFKTTFLPALLGTAGVAYVCVLASSPTTSFIPIVIGSFVFFVFLVYLLNRTLVFPMSGQSYKAKKN
jgi:hypothetical protein